MNNLQAIHQRPRPRIDILDRTGKLKLTFNVFLNQEIQSYSFSYSRESVDGSFNITFYPESKKGKPFIDLIGIMDVVQIYEDSAEYQSTKPVFTGVIKNKKFVGQMSESGLTKRLSISGIGITGLVSQFYVNLDKTGNTVSSTILIALKDCVSNGLISSGMQVMIAGFGVGLYKKSNLVSVKMPIFSWLF